MLAGLDDNTEVRKEMVTIHARIKADSETPSGFMIA